MFKNKLMLKQMGILSAILGLGLGVVTTVPFICNFAFFALFALAAPIVLVYMKRSEILGILDIREGAMYGAVIGFLAFLGFSVSFIPLATLIGVIYKGSFYLGVSLLFRSGFFVLIMMVFFVAILCSLMNAFSGLATMYVYSQIEPQPAEEQTNIEIEE